MAPAMVLGSIGMSGQVIRNDHIMTIIIMHMTATVSQTHTVLMSSEAVGLVGMFARSSGSSSESMAVNATTPRKMSGCCPLITLQEAENGLEGGLR